MCLQKDPILLNEVFNVFRSFPLDYEKSQIWHPVKSIFYLAMPSSYLQLVSKVLNTFSPAVVGEWKVGHYRECGPLHITLHYSMTALSHRERHGYKWWPRAGAHKAKKEVPRKEVDDSGADR